MPLQIPKSVSDAIGGDPAKAVADFLAKKAAHALTEGEPAPIPNPVVEQILAGDGTFEIFDDSPMLAKSAAFHNADGTEVAIFMNDGSTVVGPLNNKWVKLTLADSGIDQTAIAPYEPPPPPPPLPPIALAAKMKGAAYRLLMATDRVAIRCHKAGVAYPQAWRDYDAALRGIMNDPPAEDPDKFAWPPRPDYPAGT